MRQRLARSPSMEGDEAMDVFPRLDALVLVYASKRAIPMMIKGKILLGLLIVGTPAIALGVNWAVFNDSGLAPETMRAELGNTIAARWTPYVEKTYGAAASGWAKRMEGTFKTADIANLERAASAEDFQSMTQALLGGAGSVETAAVGKSAALGVTPTAFGSPGTDLVYTPLTPCRIIDTRIVGGPLAADSTRGYNSFTATDFASQGGDATNCGLPANVSAITVKIASVNAQQLGYFTAYPSNEPRPVAASLNYNGPVASNESHVKLCRPGCDKQFSVYTQRQSDLVVDVTGYFKEPTATALDCSVAQQSGFLDLLGGLQTRTLNCTTGYTATSGSCSGPLGLTVSGSEPLVVDGQPKGWKCDLVGSLLSGIAYKATATCCRVPGS
ncbi:hypothetical protein [Lysobacter sp. CA199]|uniref:hypothetical protein n=1 Tax=Lysobacter sp. CA199 TaxID=3455608 RepID=UPI003F8D1A7F